MTSFIQFVVALVFLPFSLTAPLAPREWDHVPIIPPSNDTWYNQEPTNLPSYAPGQIIAYRAVAIPDFFGNRVSQAWQIKYRTTDSRYNPTWAVTTLYVPTTQHDNNAILLSYQQPYDSANIDKSPSYQAVTVTATSDLQKSVQYSIALPKILDTYPSWYMNMPDYEGPKGSFASGAISGQATLDSIRAVRQLSLQTGMRSSISFAMWGYSGGALATEWAAELQGSYAPELTSSALCTLVGGLTPNLTTVFYTITETNTSSAFLIREAIQGLSTQFPELKPQIISVLGRSSWADVLEYARKLVQAVDLSGLRYFINHLLSIEDVKRVLGYDAVMGMHGVPQMDMYVYEASYDQVSPVQDVRALVNRYCGLRGKVQYEEYTSPTVDHVMMGVRGFSYGLDLLGAVVNGKKLRECVMLTNNS